LRASLEAQAKDSPTGRRVWPEKPTGEIHMNRESETAKKPRYEAFHIEGEGDNAYWTKIGALWPHSDGKGYTLNLICLPLDGRISIREPKPKKESGR
jgi:hypothetical protein